MSLKGFRGPLTTIVASVLVVSAVFITRTPVVKAQATTGTIKGVVTDPTGAVVPDADVSAKGVTTGIETKTRTNGEGIYTLPRLNPGPYMLTVQKQGYKRQEFQQVNVQVGQDSTIDAVLQAGQVTETVTVTASGEELITKEQGQISSTFEARKVDELPSNIAGGGIDTLALLAPGITVGVGNVNGNGTTFSVNGARARSNNFTIDGQDNNDLSIGGPSYFVDNQDAVAEFQVITNNFSAEYGRNQGAIVNIIGKSGTNQFHGSGFWYHRDRSNFDSLNNIEKRGGLLEPLPFLYNVYGGTIGGPVKKDRAFFFGSFQEITGRAQSLLQSNNPTIAPTGLPLLETVPGYSSNPVLQLLHNASAFAVTNIGTVSARTDKPQNEIITLGGINIPVLYPQRVLPQPFNEPEFIVRGDVKITDHHSVWYRQDYQKADNTNALTSTGSAGNVGNEPVTSRLGGFHWTWQVTNSSVNEFSFSNGRLSVIFGGGCEGKFVTCIPDPVTNIAQTLPNVSFSGVRSNLTGSALQTIGPANNLPQGRVVTSYQFQDTFAKTIGRHQLKMGADIRRLTNSVPFLPNVNGSFSFGGFGSTLSAANSVIQNRPSSVVLAAGQVTIDYNETDQFYFLQDDFKVRDNLTLNLGIRYEYTGQPINVLHDLSAAREANPATAIWRQNLPLDARIEPKLPADNNNFAPRFGFAYRPKFGEAKLAKWLFGGQDQAVISGGYSIAYDPVFYNIMLNISTSSPMVFNNTTANAATGSVAFPFPTTANGGAVQALAKANGIIAVNTFDPKWFNVTNVSPNFHSPYAEQWSLRFQREINRTNVLSLSYIGTHGVSLFSTHNGNPRISTLANGFTSGGFTFPGFPALIPQGITPLTCTSTPGSPDNTAACNGRVLPQSLIRTRDNGAQSIYHGLQAHYEGRLFNQFSFGASYTFAKNLDNASEVFSFNDPSGAQNPFNSTSGERGYSQFDHRNTFTLNYIWDIPLFKKQEGFLGRALGGWQLNGTYYIGSGQRFSALEVFNEAVLRGGGNRTYEDALWEASFLGIDTLRPFWGNPRAPRTSVGVSQLDAFLMGFIPASGVTDQKGFLDFAALNLGKVVSVTKDQVRYIFNGPGAAKIFGTPYGNVPRNIEVGPDINSLNLGLFKNFRIKENIKLQLQMTAFNALNHPQPAYGFIGNGGTPNEFVEGSSAAGVPFNLYSESTYARRAIQFGAKVIF